MLLELNLRTNSRHAVRPEFEALEARVVPSAVLIEKRQAAAADPYANAVVLAPGQHTLLAGNTYALAPGLWKASYFKARLTLAGFTGTVIFQKWTAQGWKDMPRTFAWSGSARRIGARAILIPACDQQHEAGTWIQIWKMRGRKPNMSFDWRLNITCPVAPPVPPVTPSVRRIDTRLSAGARGPMLSIGQNIPIGIVTLSGDPFHLLIADSVTIHADQTPVLPNLPNGTGFGGVFVGRLYLADANDLPIGAPIGGPGLVSADFRAMTFLNVGVPIPAFGSVKFAVVADDLRGPIRLDPQVEAYGHAFTTTT